MSRTYIYYRFLRFWSSSSPSSLLPFRASQRITHINIHFNNSNKIALEYMNFMHCRGFRGWKEKRNDDTLTWISLPSNLRLDIMWKLRQSHCIFYQESVLSQITMQLLTVFGGRKEKRKKIHTHNKFKNEVQTKERFVGILLISQVFCFQNQRNWICCTCSTHIKINVHILQRMSAAITHFFSLYPFL